MSRFALLVLSGVLAAHYAVFAATAGVARQQQQSSQDKNIDLTELTPSLESQLYEAKRLNRADPDSPPLFDLAKLVAADSDQRYEVLAGSQDSENGGDGGPGRMVSLVRDPTAETSVWLDRARLTPNNLRRRSSERISAAKANYNNNNNINDRGSSSSRGGLNPATSRTAAAAASAGARGQESSPLIMLSQRGGKQAPAQQQYAAAAAQAWARDTNRDYDDLSGPSAARSAIDNQESASLKSLWTSDLLRDLLIAQEARTRARNVERQARNYERELAKTSAASNGGGGGVNSNSNSGWFWQTNRRDKRRRCKVDPNLGVKNPSFCDTDAYFGAADYGTRDVWGDAGR